ncbi:uncharacterized protein UTRI_04014_B [Ustilago trichophora]|uniref:BTB domain-containing protein n=1 Tax=Ustilago trichophora TaxID=86804 RepID=A0A5C3EAK4_9BASI|nr:uncharacterized protein UTRI_04014_B [Ustilago trichophora]
MAGPTASSSRHGQPGRSSSGLPASGTPTPSTTSIIRRSGPGARELTTADRSAAGPSRTSTAPSTTRLAQHDDPVRAAQDEATQVWRADMRRLLETAEERFADVCWTTAAASDTIDHSDLDSDLGHVTFAGSDSPQHNSSQQEHSASIPTFKASHPSSSIPIPTASASASSGTLIWAHKAILYARAPNTFQTRFLNLRSPAAQLQHIGSTASLVSLPLHRSESQLSLVSNFSSSTQTGAPQTASNANSLSARTGIPAKPRKSVRGAAPPSSFSMTKPSLRKPISRSSISRPLRRGSVDEGSSIASGFITSDSEGEGGPATSLRASRLIDTRPRADPSSLTSPSKLSQTSCTMTHGSNGGPARKSSFASVTSAAESRLTDTRSIVSDASTLRAPISLGGVSQAFFEATLQYLYTGEEAMVDAFEFLFEDRLASDSEASPEEKLDKLRSDLTFMWRSKLYSDVKLVLGDEDDSDDTDGGQGKRRRGTSKMVDIPDANMSVLSLAQTIDTDRIEESDTEDDELTWFSTHRMILASRSQYFASLLLSPYADSRAPVLHLPSPPFTPASLHFTLGFLYTGTLFFSNRTFDLSTAFSLWRAGAYLQIETLQNLVVALIDREFCHGFNCASPQPCRKCIKRVPRTLAFATSPDVSEQALQEPAIAAVSGPHFGMYWGKDVGNLDPMLQDRIVDSVSDRLTSDPTLVVSVLRQLSIVGQRIDTERSTRWVESLRLMAETVENRLMPILHKHLEQIVTSQSWSDLLDGVGSLGDVLEKCLVMLIDGLTEARAAQIYQILVGQVLLREQGFQVASSRQAVENARRSILRYLKKRWINIRALAGFNKLERWCLKEIADELEVTTMDLVLPEEAPKVAAPPSRLLAGGRRASSVTSTATTTMSTMAGSSVRGVAPRSSLGSGATPSRLRTASAASSASNGAVSPMARRALRDEGEREAGPIHMRAAVLNRNAARTSVVNGHRTLSSASTASAVSVSSTRPAGATPNVAGRSTSSTASTPLRVGGTNGAAARSVAGSPAASTARSTPVRPTTSNTAANVRSTTPNTTTAGKERIRTTSGTSIVSSRSVSRPTATTAAPTRLAAKSSTSTASPHAFPSTSGTSASPNTNATDKASTPTRPLTALPTDTDRTPTKTLRPARSTSTLSPRLPVPPTTTASQKQSTSLDSVTTKPAQQQQRAGLAHKSSFLRATPGPGGTFSLSSTDSGVGLRARSASNGSTAAERGNGVKVNVGEGEGKRSVTPTRSVRKVSTGSSTQNAMPPNAIINVRKAQQDTLRFSSNTTLARTGSNQTIVYHPASPTKQESSISPDRGGIGLIVGIPCIVSLPAPVSSTVTRKPNAQRIPAAAARGTIPKPTATIPTVGGQNKFRAQVRYLGPVSGLPGIWVGIQLHLPTTFASGAKLIRLQNGTYGGVQYFPTPPIQGVENPHRCQRRRQLWQSISPNTPFPLKTQTEANQNDTESMIQLFVRPQEVVWVVQ